MNIVDKLYLSFAVLAIVSNIAESQSVGKFWFVTILYLGFSYFVNNERLHK